MNLDEAQRKKVGDWVAQGLKLSEIQSRLDAELGLRLTYMEVRFLVDDLKLTARDMDRPKAAPSPLTAPGAPASAGPRPGAGPAGKAKPQAAEPQAPPGEVSVSVDQLARPGAVV